ncbi:MAG: hypothetical protein KJ906_04025 [Nanoarchaeota archaeon]|nr:hypothetical protein [Nanoarchaeota archaeon]
MTISDRHYVSCEDTDKCKRSCLLFQLFINPAIGEKIDSTAKSSIYNKDDTITTLELGVVKEEENSPTLCSLYSHVNGPQEDKIFNYIQYQVHSEMIKRSEIKLKERQNR